MEWVDHYPRDASAWAAANGGESTDDEDDNLGLSTSATSTCSSSATSLTSLSGNKADLEVRGLTAFSSSRAADGDKDMLFSPFSDGSVAVYDLRRFGRRQVDHGWGDDDGDEDYDGGCRLLGRSKPGLVSVATSSGRGSYLVGGNGGRTIGGLKTTKAPSGVVECVSVDPWSGKGWVAVEGRLIEIVRISGLLEVVLANYDIIRTYIRCSESPSTGCHSLSRLSHKHPILTPSLFVQQVLCISMTHVSL